MATAATTINPQDLEIVRGMGACTTCASVVSFEGGVCALCSSHFSYVVGAKPPEALTLADFGIVSPGFMPQTIDLT